MRNPHLVTQALMVVLIGAVCWMGYQVGHLAVPATPGAPVRPAASALETAAVQYRDGLGPTFAGLRDLVRDGALKTKQGGIDYAAGKRKPLGDALNATFDANCDKDGNILDDRRGALAADLGRAAGALGAK